ncbi:MAG TPA: aldolase [Methanoregulaceae archaeon]|jgi:hypothetical protein|nr:aldolase [Methanoregulaceae archaeon]
MTYTITLISPEEKDALAGRYEPRIRYEVKSEIYGCCIKLLSDDPAVRSTWQENFFSMSQNVRSHGRLYVFADPGHPANTVLYDPLSRTAFLANIRYYGWIKSVALACAGDILEDAHGISSIHGACIDLDGQGLCVVGASGAGKTTQTYGLLSDPCARIVSDDWFFARVFGRDILAYGSEKNFYIRQDLATIWTEYAGLVADTEYDADGRAVADLRWVIGKGRLFPLTTLRTVIILKRDPADPAVVTPLSPEEGMAVFSENRYYNPHLLVRDGRKTDLRDRFIALLLERTQLFLINTTGTPAETQEQIRRIAGTPGPG